MTYDNMDHNDHGNKKHKQFVSHHLVWDLYSKDWPSIHIAQVLENGTIDYVEDPNNFDIYRFPYTVEGLQQAALLMYDLIAEHQEETFQSLVSKN